MIVEDLIRMGLPLLEGDMDVKEILKLISNVQDEKVKNFYRHVIVVEISDNMKPTAFYQIWGQETQEGKKTDFVPNIERAVGAPFVLPQGGNPIHPQGIYGVAAYPCYDRHMHAFSESPDGVASFLQGRLDRTPSVDLSEDLIKEVAISVHQTVLEMVQTNEKTKMLGVLILSDMRGSDAAYKYKEQASENHIGHSQLFQNRYIQPDYRRVLELFWMAKLQEGSEKGEREGVCTFCGKDAHLATIYCKSWPWYLPTWTCPLPQGGNEKMMVEGIGSCPECYKALVYGACLFEKFTQPIQHLLTREIFSPVSNREGIRQIARKKISDFPTIRGSGLLLPILDRVFEDNEIREEFAENIASLLKPPAKDRMLDRYIDSVTGFEYFLPDEVEAGDYRLSLIYYSGDAGKGDIHLRAYIEDVIPSTIKHLKSMTEDTADIAHQLLRAIYPNANEQQTANNHRRYRSLPYMLARGYGGPYVWDQLQAVLHRQPLSLRLPIRNVAERLRSITPRYPDSRNEIHEEVIFYLTFLEFWVEYQRKLLNGGDQDMAMRPWKKLLQVIFQHPVDQVQLESSAELGFACGAVMRQFSRQYFAVTEKDYLKQRVLTFGSDLTPEKVWRQGIKQIFEVAPRYENLNLGEDFPQRLGVVLTEYDRLKQDIEKNKDEFMASFWAGHSLQGYDRPRVQKQTETANQPE